MKKILVLLSILFCGVVHADTITLNWLNDDKTVSSTTSCTIGGDVILPTPPTKYGYTFQGWSANYIPIEYIESTGTQWIDTGILSWNNSIEYKIKLSIQQQSGGGTKTYFGCYDYWGSGHLFPAVASYFNYNIPTTFNATNGASTANIGLTYGQVGTLSLIGNTISWSEGSSAYFDRGASFTVSVNPLLFATQNASRVPGEFSAFKLFNAKFWLNNTLVRDFIPVLDKNSVACMLDKVSGTFFYNSGTGDFIAGPVVGSE